MKKIILGLLSLLFFTSIVVFSGNVYRRVGFKFSTQGLLKRILSSGTPNWVFHDQVLEEESSTISAVARVSPSVVSILIKVPNTDIYNELPSGPEGVGTGFIVSSDGLIVTNSHVVDDPGGKYLVVLNNGDSYDVTDIYSDNATDLAIVKINAENLIPVTFGDSDSIKVGQTVIAIGNALGKYGNTVTKGIISGIARELSATGGFGDFKVYEDVLQTDAALNPGNSGGPLINLSGQVVGINVATTRGAENISFSIPVNTLKPILKGFLETGKIIRPYMGVEYKVFTRDAVIDKSVPEGAIVSGVLKDTPAFKAGIEVGDIITKFDGVDVNQGKSLANMVRKHAVGDEVNLEIYRKGNKITLTVKLESFPDNLGK